MRMRTWFKTMVINLKTQTEMKKILNILLLLVAVGAFTSCQNEIIKFDESMSFVAFTSKTASVGEVNQTVAIPVLVTATEGSPAIDVSYSITSDDHSNPAIEGTDFNVIGDASLSFPNGYGYDTIFIQTVDNDVFTGTKTFSIILTSNTQSYDFGAIDTIDIALSDDDHPFGWMLGDYTAKGNSWRDAATGAEWDMVLSPIENDIYSVEILGLIGYGSYGTGASADHPVYGKIKEADDGSIELAITVGQEIPSYGYGACTLKAWYGPDGAVDIPTGEAFSGKVNNEGAAVTITFQDEYGWYIHEGNNLGLYLELVVGDGSAVNTVWTRK